jgi:hypothetical protein
MTEGGMGLPYGLDHGPIRIRTGPGWDFEVWDRLICAGLTRPEAAPWGSLRIGEAFT